MPKVEVIDGAEVSVESGFGRIDKVEYKDVNAKVTLVDVPGLRLPVTGWVRHTDPDIRALLTEPWPARVEFVVHVTRDEKIDKSIPIADVDKFDKFRKMVVFREAPGPPKGSQSPPEAQPAERTIPNEPPPNPGPTQNTDQPHRSMIKSGGDMTDTWAYTATLGVAELAFELLNDAQEAGLIESLHPAAVRDLGGRLLAIADAGQACVRPAGVDRFANSHARARGALRTILKRYEPPFAKPFDDDAWGEWQDRSQKGVCVLMTAGLDLLNAEMPADDGDDDAGGGDEEHPPTG